MNMNQRSGKILKEWAIFGAALLLLHLVFFIGIMVLVEKNPALTPALIWASLYIVAFAVLGEVFYKRLNQAHYPLEYRYAREHGLPATAKVLEIKRTRWRSEREVLFRTYRKYEHQMHIRISREGMADYEADLAEFLKSEQIPQKGAVIPVKVHPENPEVIVMVL